MSQAYVLINLNIFLIVSDPPHPAPSHTHTHTCSRSIPLIVSSVKSHFMGTLQDCFNLFPFDLISWEPLHAICSGIGKEQRKQYQNVKIAVHRMIFSSLGHKALRLEGQTASTLR